LLNGNYQVFTSFCSKEADNKQPDTYCQAQKTPSGGFSVLGGSQNASNDQYNSYLQFKTGNLVTITTNFIVIGLMNTATFSPCWDEYSCERTSILFQVQNNTDKMVQISEGKPQKRGKESDDLLLSCIEWEENRKTWLVNQSHCLVLT
jgi:hypothetical protein